jgi:CotH kinase protein
MNAHYSIISVFLLLVLAGCDTEDSNPVYDIQNVEVWDIVVPQDEYVKLLNNKWSEQEASARIHVGGKRYKASLEAQGAGSRYLPEWSYKVEMDPGNSIAGMQAFNLSAQVWDDSRIRTTLVNALYEKAGFIGFVSYPVFMRLNGKDQGLYSVIERVEEDYFELHSEYPLHELIKVGFEARFTFNNGPLKLDKSLDKKYPDDDNLLFLAEFIHALDTTPSDDIFSGLKKYLDIIQYLRYHALSSLINHKDGFTNNFYFYRSTNDAPYQIIPWDYDQAFSYTADVEYAGENDIFTKLIENDSCASIYRNQLRNLTDSVMTEAFCFPIIDATAIQIASAYSQDPSLRANGLSVFAEAEKLKSFIRNRRQFFLNILNN